MGRTNFIILGFGLATCVMLSLLMQHVLKVKRDKDVPPIVAEVTQNFGTRLVAPSDFCVDSSARGSVGVLTIHPILGLEQRHMAKAIGEYVWRRLGEEQDLAAVIVVCDTGFGDGKRYQVSAPQSSSRSVRELGPGEEPHFPHPTAGTAPGVPRKVPVTAPPAPPAKVPTPVPTRVAPARPTPAGPGSAPSVIPPAAPGDKR